MEWIEQVQRDLGPPVIEFALGNWMLLAAIGAVVLWWLFSRGWGGGVVSSHDIVLGESDADGGSGDGGGGGDGGGD